MDLFSWSGLALWILLSVIPVLGGVIVWAAVAEAREEARKQAVDVGESTEITAADWELLQSWLR
jgi:hypothetical protein